MSSEWKVPPGAQPRAQNYAFDLEAALSSVLGLTANVPSDGFTAETLGQERAGHAVLIDDRGIALTIGYLVTEASSVWLRTQDGRVVPATVIGFDGETGFGLVQALGRLDLPPLPIGSSSSVRVGDDVILAGAGGRRRSVACRVIAKEEFAGYWEYILDEAIFVAPAHPHWGGTALIGTDGTLLGIGSLQLQQEDGKRTETRNMVVPIDLLKPILGDMLRQGQPDRPARPWLGLFAAEIDGRVTVAGVIPNGPADRAGAEIGDILLAVNGTEARDLAGFFRAVWRVGPAGVQARLRVLRGNAVQEFGVDTVDRRDLLKKAILH